MSRSTKRERCSGSPNPYAEKLKKQTTIRLSSDVIAYFKQMALDTGLPYQRLIDMYLRDCMESGRKLAMAWEDPE